MQIVLVRHPAPEIAPGTCYGRLDLPLSGAGRAALLALAARLGATGISRVHSSPARRCRALADLLAPTPIIDERLRELDFGAWEGRLWDTIPRAALDAWAADPLAFAPPRGESGAALLARIAAVARDLRRADEDCIVITHGGPLKLLPALLQDRTPDLLAPSPPLGSAQTILCHPPPEKIASAAHSPPTHAAPSTSPV